MLSIKSVKSVVPLLDRVLVQRIKAAEKTASGIFLPSTSQEKIPEATVIAAGPGGRDADGKLVPMSVAAGDKIMLPSYLGGQTFKLGEEEYILLRDAEIPAKLQD